MSGATTVPLVIISVIIVRLLVPYAIIAYVGIQSTVLVNFVVAWLPASALELVQALLEPVAVLQQLV
jgi:hypothetical protein